MINLKVAQKMARASRYRSNPSPLEMADQWAGEGLDRLGVQDSKMTKAKKTREVIPGGLASGKKSEDFDQHQLNMNKALGGHKSPPKGYPESGKQYGDPQNFKYPLDTEKHVRAAISYFSKPKNAGVYSTAQQKSIWGRIRTGAKKFGIELSEESGPSSVEKCNMKRSLEALEALAMYGMDPETRNNIELSGSIDSDPAPGTGRDGMPTGVPMKPHKKPMDSLHGAIPAHQREVVAHENAQLVSKLRKGEDDVVVGVGVPEPAPETPFQLEKGRMWSQGPDSMVAYSEEADLAAERLLKSDDFYINGSPTITPSSVLIHQRRVCPACKGTFSKSLTACPKCGFGSVHQDLVKGTVEDYNPDLAKSRRPTLRPVQVKDVFLPNGVRSDDKE